MDRVLPEFKRVKIEISYLRLKEKLNEEEPSYSAVADDAKVRYNFASKIAEKIIEKNPIKTPAKRTKSEVLYLRLKEK